MRIRPLTALLGAAFCFAVLAAIGVVAHLSARGKELDADVLELVTRVRGRASVDRLLEAYVHLGDAGVYSVAAVVVVLVLLIRGERRLALLLAVVLVLAPLTAELLKEATAQARAHSARFANHIGRASWPSGHTTGATTLALCAFLAAPPRLRPAVAIWGAAYAIGMGFCVVALVWHFPSDALGAYFLSAGWVLLALAAARLPQRL
jgi:membrane-associated phospholipid phosphatase